MCSNAWLPNQALSSISVPFCFICLLHLANEKDLLLQPTGPGVLSLNAPTAELSPEMEDKQQALIDEGLDADGVSVPASASCSPGLGDFNIVQMQQPQPQAQKQQPAAAAASVPVS